MRMRVFLPRMQLRAAVHTPRRRLWHVEGTSPCQCVCVCAAAAAAATANKITQTRARWWPACPLLCLPADIKEDSCGGNQTHSVAFSDYGKMRDALNKSGTKAGRPIFFSLCGWEEWYAPPDKSVGYKGGGSLGNSYRIHGDGSNWDHLSGCTNTIAYIVRASSLMCAPCVLHPVCVHACAHGVWAPCWLSLHVCLYHAMKSPRVRIRVRVCVRAPSVSALDRTCLLSYLFCGSYENVINETSCCLTNDLVGGSTRGLGIPHVSSPQQQGKYSGPGHWADPDLLIGVETKKPMHIGGMTDVQGRSQFNLWSIFPAPLLISQDMTKYVADPVTPRSFAVVFNPIFTTFGMVQLCRRIQPYFYYFWKLHCCTIQPFVTRKSC